MAVVNLAVSVEYDGDATDSDSLCGALDTLLETALSTPGILDEYGPVKVGSFVIADVAEYTVPQNG